MKNLMIKFVLVGSLLGGVAFADAGAFAQDSHAKILSIINPSQSTGIRIGDVLNRKIELEIKPPYQIAKNALPVKGANQNGIELADIQVDTSKRDGNTIYKINLSYQVFGYASVPSIMQLPVEKLTITGGPQPLAIDIPTWRFWFSPLVPSGISNAKENLQSQYRPTLIDVSGHQIRLTILLALLVTGLAGLVYINADRRWLPFMNGAFAQVYRSIKKLPKDQVGERKALLYMHQAFNKIYGSNLFANEIEQFLVAHPEFTTLKKEVNAFFEHSNAALFADYRQNSEQFMHELIVLSKALRNCERGVQ